MAQEAAWLCHFPQCLQSYDSEPELFVHFKSEHDLDVMPEEKTFASHAQFEVWFTALQARTQTSFTCSQSWPSKAGWHIQWRCARSARRGESTLGAPLQRDIRSKPSIKLKQYCTCLIEECQRSDGSVLVNWTPLHNHWVSPTDLRSMPLSADTRAFVSTLINLGMTDKAILRVVQADVFRWENRDQFDQVVTRDLLLTMQDLRNAKRLQSRQMDADDTLSFDRMIRLLMLQNNSPVIFYKSPGPIHTHP
jgi:hypothetical protein